jgi:hypothetical protein
VSCKAAKRRRVAHLSAIAEHLGITRLPLEADHPGSATLSQPIPKPYSFPMLIVQERAEKQEWLDEEKSCHFRSFSLYLHRSV